MFSSVEEFLEISHILSEEELAEFEFNDPFMANFIVQLDTQLSQFEPLLVPENYKVQLSLFQFRLLKSDFLN